MHMRDYRLQAGDQILVNLVGGDAIQGKVAFTSSGVLFVKDARLLTPRGGDSQATLDGEARIPVASIAWMQVVA